MPSVLSIAGWYMLATVSTMTTCHVAATGGCTVLLLDRRGETADDLGQRARRGRELAPDRTTGERSTPHTHPPAALTRRSRLDEVAGTRRSPS
jgi:hypothetical protein